jgi:hypothetical protein
MDDLHNNTLGVADGLLKGESFAGAAARRAMSSAYYAVFQRLSSLCASRLSGQDPSTEDYRRLYRALEHKQVRTALGKSAYKAELGVPFAQLQDARQWADYSIAPDPDLDLPGGSTRNAQAYIDMAREVLQFIDSLDSAAQLKLAILLIVRDR